MPDIKDLKNQRAAVATKMHDLHNSYEDKPWTPEAQTQFENMKAEIEGIDNQIKNEEFLRDNILNAATQSFADNARTDAQNPKASDEDRKKAVFAKWLAGGDRALDHEDLKILNTMSTTTGSEGGYTTPTYLVPDLMEMLKDYGAMRRVATVLVTADGNPLNYPTTDGTAEEGEIVGENQSVSKQDIEFGTRALNMLKWSSKGVAVPIELLQDSALNIEEVVNRRLAERLGRVTDKYYTIGTGSNQPYGVVTEAPVSVTAGAADAVTYGEMLQLKHSVDPAYRRMGPKWMFNDKTLLYLKENLKDLQNRPLWLPSIREGEPDTLDGNGYEINQQMADIGATNTPMLFGDFKKYVIRDCMRITYHRFTDSAYAEKGQVGFLAFMRSDGRTMDLGGAIKALQSAAA